MCWERCQTDSPEDNLPSADQCWRQDAAFQVSSFLASGLFLSCRICVRSVELSPSPPPPPHGIKLLGRPFAQEQPLIPFPFSFHRTAATLGPSSLPLQAQTLPQPCHCPQGFGALPIPSTHQGLTAPEVWALNPLYPLWSWKDVGLSQVTCSHCCCVSTGTEHRDHWPKLPSSPHTSGTATIDCSKPHRGPGKQQ